MKDPIFHGIWMLFAAVFCVGALVGQFVTPKGDITELERVHETVVMKLAQCREENEQMNHDYLRFAGPYACVCSRCVGAGFPETSWYDGCRRDGMDFLEDNK